LAAFVPGALFHTTNPYSSTLRLSLAMVGGKKIEKGIGRLMQAL